MTNSNKPSASELEILRRGLPLTLDRNGAFFFEGDEVTHPRVVALLRKGLDVSESGEPIICVGEQWAYLKTDDCVLRALRAVWDGDICWLLLDDDRKEKLDFSTFVEQGDCGLSCEVPSVGSGRMLSVRLTNTAAMDFSERLVWDGELPYVELSEKRVPIRQRGNEEV